jgi:hypothetical protein
MPNPDLQRITENAAQRIANLLATPSAVDITPAASCDVAMPQQGAGNFSTLLVVERF